MIKRETAAIVFLIVVAEIVLWWRGSVVLSGTAEAYVEAGLLFGLPLLCAVVLLVEWRQRRRR